MVNMKLLLTLMLVSTAMAAPAPRKISDRDKKALLQGLTLNRLFPSFPTSGKVYSEDKMAVANFFDGLFPNLPNTNEEKKALSNGLFSSGWVFPTFPTSGKASANSEDEKAVANYLDRLFPYGPPSAGNVLNSDEANTFQGGLPDNLFSILSPTEKAAVQTLLDDNGELVKEMTAALREMLNSQLADEGLAQKALVENSDADRATVMFWNNLRRTLGNALVSLGTGLVSG